MTVDLNATHLNHWARQALDAPIYDSPLFPPSVYYRFLRILADKLRPAVAVELGVCGGGGSLYMALGNPDGMVIGVDIARDHPEQMDHIERRCPGFRFWLGDSVKSARGVYEVFGQVGLLFIDTDHTRQTTFAELEAWRPFLTHDAVICFDDLLRPDMLGVWEDLPGEKLRLDRMHDGAESGGGFGVIWGLG